VVEDSKLHQKVVKKMIHFVYPTAEVICCNDAYDAWSVLRACMNVDLMILDHNMPYAKGGDFARKVRSDEQYRSLPLVMLTSEDCEEEFLKAGVNAFLKKPFDPNKFKAVVMDLGLSAST
jgi:two-component system chemotaxis response regulator CheY